MKNLHFRYMAEHLHTCTTAYDRTYVLCVKISENCSLADPGGGGIRRAPSPPNGRGPNVYICYEDTFVYGEQF